MNDFFQISYIIEIRVWDIIDILIKISFYVFLELASNNYFVNTKKVCFASKQNAFLISLLSLDSD